MENKLRLLILAFVSMVGMTTFGQEDPTLKLSETKITFAPDKGSKEITITSNTKWEVSSDISWASVTPKSGTGNGKITITVDTYATNSIFDREATIIIECGGVDYELSVTQKRPTISFTPKTVSFDSDEKEQTIEITSNTKWEANSDQDWLTIEGPKSGTKNGTLTIKASKNSSKNDRSGRIEIKRSDVAEKVNLANYIGVKQTAAPYIEIKENNSEVERLNIEAFGERRILNVESNVSWTASCNKTWVTITRKAESNNTELIIDVPANSENKAQNATITISSDEFSELYKEINIIQVRPNLSLGRGDFTIFYKANSEIPFEIFSNVNWEVSVTSEGEWVKIVTPTTKQGQGDGIVTLSAQENTSTKQRAATISVWNRDIPSMKESFEIRQEGFAPYLTVSKTDLRYNDKSYEQSFDVSSNVNWTASIEYKDGSGWLTVTPGKKEGIAGDDVTEVKVTPLANSGASPREATITITGGSLTQTVKVYQSGSGYLTVSTTSLRYNPEAGTQKFSVRSNVNWNITIDGGNGWLEVTPMSKTVTGNDVTEITVATTDNTGNPNPREATITITGGSLTQTVKVYQNGNGYLTVSTTNMRYNPEAGTQKFNVSSNVNWSVTMDGGNGWLEVTPMSKNVAGNDVTEITVAASDNTGNSSPREATITITGSGLTQTIKIHQDGYGYLTTNTTDLRYSPQSGVQEFSVSSNVNWNITVSGGNGWLDVSPMNKEVSGNDETNVIVKVSDNSGNSSPREATITITGGGLEQVVKVIQNGKGYLTASVAEIRYGSGAGENKFNIQSNVSWNIITEGGNGWLTVTPTNKTVTDNDEQEVIVKVGDNTSNNSLREATITITGSGITQVVRVIQSGNGYLNADKAELNYGSSDGTQYFNINSNIDWRIIIEDGCEWISVNPLTGSKSMQDISVSVSANTTGKERESSITLIGDGVDPYVIKVYQSGSAITLATEPTSMVFNKDGGKAMVKIITDATKWTANFDGDWLTINGGKDYTGSGGVTNIELDVLSNDYENDRNDSIKFVWTNNNIEETYYLPVLQHGVNEMTIVPNNDNFVGEDSINFTVKEQNVDIMIKARSGISWYPEYKPDWITIHKIQNDGGKDTISYIMPLTISENKLENDLHDRIILRYEDGYGNLNTITLKVSQNHRPKLPTLYIQEAAAIEQNVIEPTIGDNAQFTINIDDNNFDSEDSYEKWEFQWFIDGEILESTIHQAKYTMVDNKAHLLRVIASYKDDITNNSLKVSKEFKVYPKPQAPETIQKKGEGLSGIMIATMPDNMNDEQRKTLGYEYVFGYDDTGYEPTTNRYYQYNNREVVTNATINKWVYTQWTVDSRTVGDVLLEKRIVRSKNRANTIGDPTPVSTRLTTDIKSVKDGEISLRQGHLKAMFATPTPATISVVAPTGVVMKRISLSPRCEYNENIDLSGLESGMYIIRCVVGHTSVEEKLVIK